MTQYLVVGLILLVGLLVMLERNNRSPKKKRGSSGDVQVDPGRSVISADEADPTQSGRYRAMKVKAEVQKARQSARPAKPKEEPRSDLPDPFNVELQDPE